MKKQSFAAFIATALIATATLSHATLAGMPSTDGTLFATWDVFGNVPPGPPPASLFSNLAPNQSDAALFSATLTSETNGLLLGSGDRIYEMGNPFDLTINGTAAGSITTLSLQMKFTAPSVGSSADFFSISLTGGGTAAQAYLGSVTEGANTFSIYQWTWTGLSIPASSSLEISISSPAEHVSVDTIRLTNTAAAAVPEPSTYALIVLGLGAVVIASRGCRLRA